MNYFTPTRKSRPDRHTAISHVEDGNDYEAFSDAEMAQHDAADFPFEFNAQPTNFCIDKP